MEGKYLPTSSIRLRCMAAEIREEAIEYEFRPMTQEAIAELECVPWPSSLTKSVLTINYRKLSFRNRQVWRSLPSHLKPTSNTAHSEKSRFVPTTLAINHLTFLQTDFQIYRLMEKESSQATVSLIETASEIMEIVSNTW